MLLFEDILGLESAQALAPLVEELNKIKDEELTAETLANMNTVFITAVDSSASQSIKDAREEFRRQGMNRAQAFDFCADIGKALKAEIDELKIESKARLDMYYSLADAITRPFYAAADILDNADATIGWELMNENAKVPTYAYAGDACADIYASEDIVVPKHALGVQVHTGLKAAIPMGWFLEIRARSGMSMRTPLRLSNCIGTIDTGYKGEIMVLFDNISGKDYTIKAGDRIAQIRLEPAYRFRSEIVPHVGESERGEGGFGSSDNK